MVRLIVVSLVRIYIRIFYRHRIYGKKHFFKGGGMICSNHSSYLDPPLIGASCPGIIHFLGRNTLFHSFLFAWLIRKLNTHPVRPGKENINAFKKAVELIQSGNKVVIFPEGHRSRDGEFQRGQLGVGMLVQKTKCQIIPIYLHGSYEIWNTKRRFPRLVGKTACVFGKPLTFIDLERMEKKEAQAAIVVRIMEKIQQLQEWYTSGREGLPP